MNNDLSEEEKKILAKHRAIFNENQIKSDVFWEQEYPHKTIEEKIDFWLSEVHRGMRYQGESINDEYSEFSCNWHVWVKSKEPNFDEIFIVITKKLGFEFDWQEYYKRIQRPSANADL